jgi:uncharacterized protein YwbE
LVVTLVGKLHRFLVNCTEQDFTELSKLSGGTVSKILSKSNIKPHKISGYIERRDPEFKIKSAAVLHTYNLFRINVPPTFSENLLGAFPL